MLSINQVLRPAIFAGVFAKTERGGHTKVFDTIREDIYSVFDRDPAARSVLEIIFCYPGLHVVWFYRIAHWFWTREFYFLGRLTSHFGRFLTGIEIHPGAQIGEKFFIDHGMGVVIGETAEIGDNVTLYHGVTLGGVTWDKVKRHPTVGDNVVIGSGAKVLGPFTVGSGAKIGSNSVVVKEVPPNSSVVGIPGRVVMQQEPKSEKAEEKRPDLEHGKMPDPEAKAISCLFDQIRALEKKVEGLTDRLEKAESKPATKATAKSSARSSAKSSAPGASTEAPVKRSSTSRATATKPPIAKPRSKAASSARTRKTEKSGV
jgi:serine O-acetyltransferase